MKKDINVDSNRRGVSLKSEQKRQRRIRLAEAWETAVSYAVAFMLVYAALALPPVTKVVATHQPISLGSVGALGWLGGLGSEIQITGEVFQPVLLVATIILYPVILVATVILATPVYWAIEQFWDLERRHWQAARLAACILLSMVLAVASAAIFYGPQ